MNAHILAANMGRLHSGITGDAMRCTVLRKRSPSAEAAWTMAVLEGMSVIHSDNFSGEFLFFSPPNSAYEAIMAKQ